MLLAECLIDWFISILVRGMICAFMSRHARSQIHMKTLPSRQGIKLGGWLAMALSMTVALPALANLDSVSEAGAHGQGTIRVEQAATGKISLEVRAAKLAEVLDALGRQTGVPIRHDDALAETVTLSCHGDNLESTLRCLLGTDASLLVTYAEGAGKYGQRRVESIKVLSAPAEHPALSSAPGTLDAVMAMTRSADPEQRALALERLRRLPDVADDTLRRVYQSALNDTDGDVRAEAVSGLSLLDDEGSFPLLSSAMSDAHPSVRLAALDGMDLNQDSRPIYEQALNDPDEDVRELAALRLGLE